MKIVRSYRAALAASVIFGFLIVAPLNEAVAQRKKADYVVLVLEEGSGDNAKCVTTPDTLHVTNRGRADNSRPVRINFVAMGPNVEVSELDKKSGKRHEDTGKVEVEVQGEGANRVRKIKRDSNGQKLSKTGTLKLANQGDDKTLKLNINASGTYQYNVTCDGTPDDPPAIIVD